jgi:hypothetical protein
MDSVSPIHLAQRRAQELRQASDTPKKREHITRPEREAHNIFRDPRFLDDEANLDSIITHAVPELALPIEASLLDEVAENDRISEGLARVTLKAIAISQVARQAGYTEPNADGDPTYSHLGMLLDKTLRERALLYSEDSTNEESTYLTGTISEIAFYALAAYDDTFSSTLTRRTQDARPRYVMPSTMDADRGGSYIDTDGRKVRTGFDFTVTYVEGKDPHRYVQVKTTPGNEKPDNYASGITLVTLRDLLTLPKDFPMHLARTIAKEATGQSLHGVEYRRMNGAARRLNKLIE